jgi:hypothetical protein
MQAVAVLGPGGLPSDCATASFGPAALIAYTTSMSTATVAEPVQGGSVTFTATGTNFSCAAWTVQNGPGKLVAPRILVDGAGDDEAQGLILLD